MEMAEFELASLDRKAKIATCITFLLVSSVAAVFVYYAVRWPDKENPVIIISAACLAMLTGILPVLWAPRKYWLDDENIFIHRPIGDVKLPLASISSVQLPDIKLLNKGTARAIGSGGHFGYFGWFCNDTYGDLKCYATRTKDSVVLIRCGKANYLLSPKDALGFMQAVKERIEKLKNKI